MTFQDNELVGYILNFYLDPRASRPGVEIEIFKKKKEKSHIRLYKSLNPP